MKRTPVETEEELQWVVGCMLLPIVLDVLERDISALDTLNLKMSVVYIRSLRRVQDQASEEMADLRGKLRNRGIRVYDQRRTKEQVEADFVCRGYHRKCSMPWDVVKAEVKRKLGAFMAIDLAE